MTGAEGLTAATGEDERGAEIALASCLASLVGHLQEPYRQAIGTSNFFELAVAVALSLFGLTWTAALATVVGVLIEVHVMLSLVAFANRTRRWFSATAPA